MDAKVETGPEAGPKAKIFISYSRKDMAFADRLEAAMKARGFEPLIDRTEIYAFEDWWKRIEVLIGQADTVVFVLSPDAVRSEVALKEVAYAASLNKRFAPIACRPVEDSSVPEALRRFNFIFFDDMQGFEGRADKLAEALQTDIVWIRHHTEFGEAARAWSAAGRPVGLLLRPPALEQAERWIASRPPNAPVPTEETSTFIVASRRAATRRRNVLTAGLGVGVIVALVFAGFAYWQRNRAEAGLAATTQLANSIVFITMEQFRRHGLAEETERMADLLVRGYSQVIAIDPTPGAYYGRATAYLDKRDFDNAIADYTRAIGLDANSPVGYNGRGNAYLEKGDVDKAIVDYSQAMALNPKFANAFENRGSAYHVKGDFDRSLADLNQAISLAPKLVSAYNKRGNTYRSMGELDRALADYNRAIALDPKLVTAHFGRALTEVYLQSLPEAFADFSRSNELNPTYAYAALWLDIVAKRSNLPTRLAQWATRIDMTKWPAPIVRLFLGQLSEAEVRAAAENRDLVTEQGQVCETNFYFGERALQHADKENALRHFQLAATNCPKGFDEWASARAELKMLSANP